MADFCTTDELRSYIAQTGQTPLTDLNDPYLDLAIASATTAIQTASNRTFELVTAAAARTFTYTRAWNQTGDYYGAIDWAVVYPSLYSGSEPPSVEVDDFFLDPVQLIPAITVTDYLTSTAYTPTRAWPYNAAAKGMPYTRLEFGATVSLPTGEGNMIVTAKWGWQSVPDTIKNACLLQASRYYARRTSPMGVAGFGDMGSAIRLQARLDPDVEQMVSDFQRYWIAA